MAHYFIEIRDLDEEFASYIELNLRQDLMEGIEQRELGRITGAGSGFGCMDLSVEIEDSTNAYDALVAFVQTLVDSGRVEISKMEQPDVKEEDQARLNRLGRELGPETCQHTDCDHLRLARSVFCRVHHFRQVWGRFPSVDSAD